MSSFLSRKHMIETKMELGTKSGIELVRAFAKKGHEQTPDEVTELLRILGYFQEEVKLINEIMQRGRGCKVVRTDGSVQDGYFLGVLGASRVSVGFWDDRTHKVAQKAPSVETFRSWQA